MVDSKKSLGLKEDPVVERLVRDPSQPEAKLVSGYLGKSEQDGYWRIYLNLEFSDYLEVSEADVLHVEKLAGEDSSASGSWVWVKEGARVKHVQTRPRQAQAEFLRGDIATAFLSQAATRGFAGGSLTIFGLLSTFTVTECATCPTNDGSHSCVPAVCTLATSCLTTVPTDPGCGGKIAV